MNGNGNGNDKTRFRVGKGGATSLTTLSETAASATAAVNGGRALLMQYALVVDVGAALGPITAYVVTDLFGVNAIYIVSGIFFCIYGLVWLRQRP